MSEIMLKAQDITKRFSMGTSYLDVLTGVSLEISAGEIVAIVGESGAGKSTLLHILGMIDRPTTGTLSMNGDNLSMKTEVELAELRNKRVGFIFQFHHLLPEFNAIENVVMPAMIAGAPLVESRERAEYLLDRVGLSERLLHRPGELSGGELQRVAVARALINEPAVVMADEPSGNLDHKNSEKLHDLIWSLAREHNSSFVIVTHDMHLAQKADRVLHLGEGSIREVDPGKIHEYFLG